MYDVEEMTVIAELCKKYNVIVIADEVYEWLVYPGCNFIKMGKIMCVVRISQFVVIVLCMLLSFVNVEAVSHF